MKGVVISEGIVRQGLESATNHGVRHGVAAAERPFPHVLYSVRDVDRGELCVSERRVADGKEVCRQGHGTEIRAVVERRVADVGDARGNFEALKRLDAVKRFIPDYPQAVVVKRHILQIGIVLEAPFAEFLHAADADVARPLGIVAVGMDEAGATLAGDDERVEVRRLRREHPEVNDVRLR